MSKKTYEVTFKVDIHLDPEGKTVWDAHQLARWIIYHRRCTPTKMRLKGNTKGIYAKAKSA